MNSRRLLLRWTGVALASLGVALPAHAQAHREDTGGRCVPADQRAGRTYGCFILAAEPVGPLAAPVWWHLETFPSTAAATAAKGVHATVLVALGKVWLATIADSAWRSAHGTHVATIGPVPVAAGTRYTAQYMEAVFRPGMKSLVHRHSGAEAWYTMSGETCLETPRGVDVSKPGGPSVIVPGGGPMELTATGSTIRRGLVLILHDASQPPTSPAPEWTPKGLCTRGGRG